MRSLRRAPTGTGGFMRRFVFASLGLIVSALIVAAFTSSGLAAADDAGSATTIKADQMKWSPAPPGLPSGAVICVLEGDPSKPGLFAIRVKVPSGYVVRPHWHSNDENITVISGKMFLGHGDKFDKSIGQEIGPGDFARMPAKMHHFAYNDEETIFQLHGMGPFDIHYINPDDDPRGKANAGTSGQ
jgi:uncharacterized RmlC-like cupin family protein